MTGHSVLFDTKLVRIRRQRARLASRYPDFLESHVARDIAARLQVINKTFNRCLIIGGASAGFARLIKNSLEPEILLGDPVAVAGIGTEVVFDEEFLPAGDDTLDCVIAAPGFELVNDFPGVLIQIRRALCADGLFIGAVFAGDSLTELRQAWLEAESQIKGGASPRVAPFADVRQTGNLLMRAGFALPVSDIETLTIRYPSALDMMRDLKAMGLSNPLSARSRTPVTRPLLARACAIYEQNFAHDDGRVPATFQINYLTGWVPHESQQKPLPPGSASMSLAQALKRKK